MSGLTPVVADVIIQAEVCAKGSSEPEMALLVNWGTARITLCKVQVFVKRRGKPWL
jgi:hypothetical protein